MIRGQGRCCELLPCPHFWATPGTVGQWGRTADADTIDCCQTHRENGCDESGQPCYVENTLSVTQNRKWFVNAGTSITLDSSFSVGAKAGIGDLLGAETSFTVGASWNFEVSGGFERSVEVTQTSSAAVSAPCCGKTYYDAAVWTRSEPASATVKFMFGDAVGLDCTVNGETCYSIGNERIATDTISLSGTNTNKKYSVCDLTCATYNENCCESETDGTMGACAHLTPPE